MMMIPRKAMRRGLTFTAFDIDALIDKSDRKLFWQTTQPGHSLRHFLPLKSLHKDLTSSVRGNIHISFPLFYIRSLKIVVYLNMHTVSKKGATIFLPLTLPNNGRFSKFFHPQT